jgi:hypothetical protein
VVIAVNGIDVLHNLFFSDEAWFHVSSCVSSQNCGCRAVNIHMSYKTCPCILKKLRYGVLSHQHVM